MVATNSKPVIEIAGLSKSFNGGRPVISNLSLRIDEGEFVVITGPSGIGKSLLLRIVCGLEKPTEGVVRLDGQPVTSPPLDFAIVFQDYRNSLLLWKTALENVMLALTGSSSQRVRSAEKRETARHYLHEVGLEEYGDYYPYQLSGGQQQRICFARALAPNPRFLLLDEPFGSVDHLTKLELEDLLLSLYCKHGFTCLMTTHDLDEAAYLASRVIVFSRPSFGVRAEIKNNLPYPRSQDRTRFDPEFDWARARLYHLFTGRRDD
ncbi:MAG TPA: ABC transporter ATP-binding protein [Blastocatellia bacterium]|nr:ABC transporter ATP-binding protein [Blastocatellia bacterium]